MGPFIYYMMNFLMAIFFMNVILAIMLDGCVARMAAFAAVAGSFSYSSCATALLALLLLTQRTGLHVFIRYPARPPRSIAGPLTLGPSSQFHGRQRRHDWWQRS